MDNEVNLTVLTIKELYDLGARGIIPTEYVDIEIMRRVKEELKQKYHYWQGTGKDTRWKVHYYIDGQRHDKKCATEKDMISFLLGLEGKGDSSKEKRTFKQCYDEWHELKALQVDDNTIDKYDSEYRRHIKGSEFENIPIDMITKDEIIRFMIDKILHPTWRKMPSTRPLCKRSAKQLWYMIKNTFEWAEEHDYIDADVTVTIRAAKAFLCLSEEHDRLPERIVISAGDNALLNDQYRADHENKPEYIPTYAVEMIKLTGERAGEIATLQWQDIIELPGQGLHFCIQRRESKNKKTGEMRVKPVPKNKKVRYVPITPEMQALLDTVKLVESERGWLSEWIFCDDTGRITVSKISSCLQNKCKQAKITTRGCYAYRRTLNSHLRADGMDPTAASSILGNTVNVNNQYYTFDVRDGNDKRERLSKVNRRMG